MTEQAGDRYTVRLQAERLELGTAYDSVSHGNVGAIAVFVGTTREFTAGRGTTVRLEYDCYPAMALAEMGRLCSSTLSALRVERLFIVHRTGPVPLGEASVIVAVSAAHRDAALTAARHLIDTLKVTVPIWKKEVYADGRSEWIQGGSAPNETVE